MSLPDTLLDEARQLSHRLRGLSFPAKVTHVYNPLDYAWAPFEAYTRRFATGTAKVLWMGMNPGPWGMAQTGVPFGEVAAVRDWLQIDEPIGTPVDEHPKRPIEGFDCKRSEVSGRRVWTLFQDRFGTPDAFFRENYVFNYCPLVLMEASGRNFTPDKLPVACREPLEEACDHHLRRAAELLGVTQVVGIGAFAEKRATAALAGLDLPITRILHPSPASPLSNKDWPGTVTRQLVEAGLWS